MLVQVGHSQPHTLPAGAAARMARRGRPTGHLSHQRRFSLCRWGVQPPATDPSLPWARGPQGYYKLSCKTTEWGNTFAKLVRDKEFTLRVSKELQIIRPTTLPPTVERGFEQLNHRRNLPAVSKRWEEERSQESRGKCRMMTVRHTLLLSRCCLPPCNLMHACTCGDACLPWELASGLLGTNFM